jgi:hypothetical protein
MENPQPVGDAAQSSCKPGNTQEWRHYAIASPSPVITSALIQLRHSVAKGFKEIVNERHIR